MHTGNLQRQVCGRILLPGFALVAGLVALFAAPAKAAPFTTNFNALITDLQDRAATLSNSTDKVQQKQFQTIEKILGTFDKDSTSLATDIKTLGTVSKTLIKSFPADFTPPGGSLLTNLTAAADGLTNDVQAVINTAATNIDALADSSCKTKAQMTLGDAQEFMDQAVAATSFATMAKLLGSSLKDAQKADAAAAKCAAITGGGGGPPGGDFLKATITGNFANSFATTLLPPVAVADTNGVLLSIVASEVAFGGTAMDLIVRNVSGPNTYPIDQVSDLVRTTPKETYFIGATGTGSVTFTTLDIPGRKLVGSFFFTCSTADMPPKSVTVTNGTFSISHIGIVPSP